MTHFDLIHSVCKVVAEIESPIQAIYYIDNGEGYVETNVLDEGEYLSYSCNSIEEFYDIVNSLIEGVDKHPLFML